MAVSNRKEELYKTPPHNIEAEQSVLGSILIEKDSIARILDILTDDGSDFYHKVHAELFKGMVSLFEKNIPVDVVTVADLFKTTTILGPVGGLSYIGVLAEATPTASNITYYAKIVKEKSLLRRMISTTSAISARGYESMDSVEEYIDDSEQKIFEVTQDRAKKTFFALKDIIKDTFESIEKLYAKKNAITGVATGFTDLDRLTAGFQNSDLIIIAGRPSMGKTSFALNIAEMAALDHKAPVAVFSLEMSKEQLVQRMLSSRAKVDLGKLRSGFLKEEDWPRLTNAVGALFDAPVFIDDTPAQSVLEMRAKARRWKSEFGLKMVIVDYLQLMRGRRSSASREQEISEISRSLKAMAKELHIPVVALSQLSRMTERREGNKPMLSDLRESGAIEQDADVVMFVYRDSVYRPCECPKDYCSCGKRGDAEIIVAKQRNGPTDTIHLTFRKQYTRFENQDTTHGDYESRGEWVEE
ncbi:MAG: replicative DNA helicase [Thermodesulfobacteriota bacterium]